MRDLVTSIDDDLLLSDADPVRRVQNEMRKNLPKRFYKDVTVTPVDGGFAVHLDGRPARTPGRALLALPTEASAQLVADEFAAQETVIDPVTMPTMRLANTAIDGVANEPDAVAEDILRFASSDMLCYRADGPDGLVKRQNEAWDPLLDWATSTLGARFNLAEGVMHVTQPPQSITALRIHIDRRREPFRLAAMHLMTSLTGSALIALAVENGHVPAEEAWRAAHVDEDWQSDQWGQDAEAIARRNNRWRDMKAAANLLAALPAVAP